MVHSDYAVACLRDAMTAWNGRDWAAFETLHTPGVVYESPHHPLIVGRSAVVRRYQDLAYFVPDWEWSELQMIENDRGDHRAVFECTQTGTLADIIDAETDIRGPGSPFVVPTTVFVRFADDGRVAALRTVHRRAHELLSTSTR
jgi:hypothetical protein